MSGSSISSSFFKVLIDDFKTQLCLPSAFTMNFDGTLPEKCILSIPAKSCWIVSIKNVDGVWIFWNEWQLFVNDNALEFGEFLAFQYRGNSEFIVTIFGRNACSRELDIGDKDARSEKIIDQKMAVPRRMASTSVSQNTKCRMAERREEIDVSNSFSVTLAPYRKFILIVPRWFARKIGLPDKQSIVLLDPQGRSWRVKISHQKNGGTFLSTGWLDFCRSNNLSTNDTCHFEFVEGIGNVIRVDFSRRSDHHRHHHNYVNTSSNLVTEASI